MSCYFLDYKVDNWVHHKHRGTYELNKDVILMNRNQNFIILTIKRFFYTFFPFIVLLYIFYEIILNGYVKTSWLKLIIYAVLISLITARHFNYSTKKEEVKDIDDLQDSISWGRWKTLQKGEDELLLKPSFDYPYSILNNEIVLIQFREGTATIKGTSYYVEQLSKEITGKGNKWKRRIGGIITFLIIALVIYTPILFESGKDWDLRIRYHNYKMKNIETVAINDKYINGNTVGNINNYGYAVENDEYIYYIEDNLSIIRTDKEFKDKDILISKSQGTGINRLNIIDDWVFYMSGKSLNRMRLDGTNNKTIYSMSYLLDINTIGEWLFFINFADNHSIYRIDVNGQNLQRFINVEATDIATYGDRLIYSYADNDKVYVASINFEGSNRKTEFIADGEIRHLSKSNGYYYYINENSMLVRNEGKNYELIQEITNQNISSYIMVDDKIYYSAETSDKGHLGVGLYRMELDGSGKILISDTSNVSGFSHVGNWLLYESSDDNRIPSLKRLNLDTGEIYITSRP